MRSDFSNEPAGCLEESHDDSSSGFDLDLSNNHSVPTDEVVWPSASSIKKIPTSSRASLRFLLSNDNAGKFIGKSGESIQKLQNQCGCKVSLSRANDFFPGTSDRVCLVQGDNYDDLKHSVGLILERFRDVGVSLSFFVVPANKETSFRHYLNFFNSFFCLDNRKDITQAHPASVHVTDLQNFHQCLFRRENPISQQGFFFPILPVGWLLEGTIKVGDSSNLHHSRNLHY